MKTGKKLLTEKKERKRTEGRSGSYLLRSVGNGGFTGYLPAVENLSKKT